MYKHTALHYNKINLLLMFTNNLMFIICQKSSQMTVIHCMKLNVYMAGWTKNITSVNLSHYAENVIFMVQVQEEYCESQVNIAQKFPGLHII